MTVLDHDNPKISAALHYASNGLKVIQLYGLRDPAKGTGCTCERGPDCTSAGKHPRFTEWQKLDAPSEAEILEWWSGWRSEFNVGIATGQASGFWVLDVDPKSGGLDAMNTLVAQYGSLPATLTARTGSGGWHYYFALPADFVVTNRQGTDKNGIPRGIDIRGEGGQVVAPPSVTDKGAYTYLDPDAPIVAAPDWLLRMVRSKPKPTPATTSFADDLLDDAERKRLAAYAEQAYHGELNRLRECSQKGWDGPPWDATCFEVACNLIELANATWSGYDFDTVRELFFAEAPSDERFTAHDHEVKWESALKKIGNSARAMPSAQIDIFSGPDVRVDPRLLAREKVAEANPGQRIVERSWDDLGNARRLVDHYGDVLRYVHEAESWARYTDGRWMLDKAGAQPLIHDLFDGRIAETEGLLYDDTPTGEDGDKPSVRAQFLAFLAKQRMSARIQACRTEAAARPELRISLNDFDADPLLLNVANGVVNLANGTLRDHDPALLLRQQSPVVYDPAAPCHLWQQFLDRVMPDQEMQSYLQRVVGYSITGCTQEQAMFMHYGAGANGKSVLLEVMSAVTGSYGQTVPRETLLVRANGSTEHPTSVARMAGMRFLQVSETAAGRRLDEEMVKGLTGGEKQTARFMNRDFFDFKPTGKIHYVTNHLPRLTDAESIWRRLHLIGWRVRIPEAEQDKDLAQKIIARELSGVLAWAVRGVSTWLEQSLKPPSEVVDDLAQYRQDQDLFGDFLFDVCLPAPEHFVSSAEIYSAYQIWTMQVGIKQPMTRQTFAATLRERGFPQSRTMNVRGFVGLALRTSVTTQ